MRAAYDMFAAMGANAFAERARRELVATGEHVRKREVETRNELTPQEEHIARLARDGRTNPEIGSELFISARTVEWHLRKVFTKLGITSRKGLNDALARDLGTGLIAHWLLGRWRCRRHLGRTRRRRRGRRGHRVRARPLGPTSPLFIRLAATCDLPTPSGHDDRDSTEPLRWPASRPNGEYG